MTAAWRARLAWVALPPAILVALWLALAGWHRTWTTPINGRGEALITLAAVKGELERETWWRHPAPINGLVVRAVHLATADLVAATNISWLLLLMAGGLSTAWCLRLVGASRLGGWAAGLLFALCPFALLHNLVEPTLTPYLIPFAATLAIRIATDGDCDWRRRDIQILAAGCVGLGVNGGDHAVFGALFVAIGAIAGAVRARRLGPVASGLAVAAVIALGAVIAAQSGATRDEAARGRETAASALRGSEIAGLKIRHLVTPLEHHWVPWLNQWAEAEREHPFPYQEDNTSARLGLVGSVGFVGLLAVLFLPGPREASGGIDRVRAAAGLNLAAVLVGTVGGLSTVAAVWFGPLVSAGFHVTPYIAFFSLAATTLWLDRTSSARPMWHRAVWCAVLLIGLLDQAVALRPLNTNVATERTEFRRLRSFVDVLEQRLPSGARVFQWPVRPFPGDRDTVSMRAYDHIRPYLVSGRLFWSYPPSSDRGTQDLVRLSTAPLDSLPTYLAREGYAALLLDRYASVDDGESDLAALLAAPGSAGVIAQSDRYVAIALR